MDCSVSGEKCLHQSCLGTGLKFCMLCFDNLAARWSIASETTEGWYCKHMQVERLKENRINIMNENCGNWIAKLVDRGYQLKISKIFWWWNFCCVPLQLCSSNIEKENDLEYHAQRKSQAERLWIPNRCNNMHSANLSLINIQAFWTNSFIFCLSPARQRPQRPNL